MLEKILAQVKIAQRVSAATKAVDDARHAANEAASGTGKDNSSPAPILPKSTIPRSAVSTETTRLNDFCETITKAVAEIDKALKHSKKGQAVLKSMNTQGVIADEAAPSTFQRSVKSLDDPALKAKYEEWAKANVYSYHNWEMPGQSDDILGPSFKHVYSSEARSIQSYPARNTALMKEVGGIRRVSLSLILRSACFVVVILASGLGFFGFLEN